MRYFTITRDGELRGLGFVQKDFSTLSVDNHYRALGPTSGVNVKRLVHREFGENYSRRSVSKAEWETLREFCDVPVYEVTLWGDQPVLSRVIQ